MIALREVASALLASRLTTLGFKKCLSGSGCFAPFWQLNNMCELHCKLYCDVDKVK